MDPWKRLALTIIRVQTEIAEAKAQRSSAKKMDPHIQACLNMETKKDNDRSFDAKNPVRAKRQPGKERAPKRVQEKYIDTGYAGASGPWMVLNPSFKGQRMSRDDMAGSYLGEDHAIGLKGRNYRRV